MYNETTKMWSKTTTVAYELATETNRTTKTTALKKQGSQNSTQND